MQKSLKWIIILVLTSSMFVIYMNLHITGNIWPTNDVINEVDCDYHGGGDNYAINTEGCRILKLDPYHRSLLKYYRNSDQKQLNCTFERMVISNNKKLQLNHRQFNFTNIKCYCSQISRVKENKIEFTQERLLHKTRENIIKSEFIKIKCLEDGNVEGKKRIVYEDFIPFIQRKPQVEKRVEKLLKSIDKDKSLNILLLGLDSVSKNSYVRNMKLVDKYIRKNLTYVELHGYHKVGLNTYPNMIPFHTGKLEKEFDINHSKSDLNILPFAWKKFSNRGYRTLFAEDLSGIATFNHNRRGFDKQPFDYYMRPFSLAVDKSNIGKTIDKTGCLPNRALTSVMFNWTSDFFDEFSSDPLFAYIFISGMTHDDYNGAAYHDKPILNFLQKLHDNGHLNKTIVFFFSDHGFRTGNASATYMGYLEEKLPFFFFLLPDWFPQKFPQYYSNMKINENRLVTPLDMHATMMDISTQLQNVQTNVTRMESISLFYEIPTTRTCADAKIHSLFCTCVQRRKVCASDNKLIEQGAAMILEFINKLIAPYNCRQLVLDKIIDVSVQSDLADASNETLNHLITFSVEPGNGVFQGIAIYNKKSRTFTVEDKIDRVNKYGGQAYCVFDAYLKPYCYC